MHYAVGIAGLAVFMTLAWAASYDRKLALKRLKYVAIMLAIQVVLGFFLIRTAVGQTVVDGIASGFSRLLEFAFEGTSFVFGGLAGDPDATNGLSPAFFMAVLMPIVFISAIIGILEWSRLLHVVIRYLGLAVGKINGLGKLESFGASASLLLGQSEVFIALKNQLHHLNERRLYTLAAAAMSTVSASIMGSYMVLLDPQYVVTAIALNFFGIFIVVTLINPYDLEPSEDVAVFSDARHRSFFEMLTEYIWDGFRVAIHRCCDADRLRRADRDGERCLQRNLRCDIPAGDGLRVRAAGVPDGGSAIGDSGRREFDGNETRDERVRGDDTNRGGGIRVVGPRLRDRGSVPGFVRELRVHRNHRGSGQRARAGAGRHDRKIRSPAAVRCNARELHQRNDGRAPHLIVSALWHASTAPQRTAEGRQ
ncbi:NupC [Hoyosella subflava DQS3-9A1]|uniref:NupC n=1 Tax=Hoyosella subflava (strain DSM 45089 / JCM 17490 / NBRC 109087 / DQS3-9A1) TaxID=443218 RepID=F6EF21_HOYSD|nr:NupC [Hoyosella subflava DQS3-9A1]